MIKKVTLFSSFLSLFWNVAHAQLPNYVPTNGLLAWYAFESNGNDLSGNNNNATNNNVTFVDDRNGVANAAGSFDGANTWMEVTTPTFSFGATDSFSYSFWIKKDVQPLAGIVLMIADNVSGNFISLIQGITDMEFGTNKQQSAWVWTTCPHTLNVWDHYVTTYNAGVMNLYKNGVFQSTNTFTYTNVTTANLPLYIGKGFGGGNFLGAIDDVGIWGRALSAQEISDVYTNTVTSIKTESQQNQISLTQNIAANEITLQNNATNNYSANLYTIIDFKGTVVKTGNITQTTQIIDIQNLAQGIYLLQVNDKTNTNLKFIKY